MVFFSYLKGKNVVIFFSFLLFHSSIFILHAQSHWDSLPGIRAYSQNQPFNLYTLYADSNYLYMTGLYDTLEGKRIRGIGRWNGVKWDSMGAGIDGLTPWNSPDNVLAITTYHNKIYVGGEFNSLGNVKALEIGTWNGTAWDSLPVQPFSVRGNNCACALATINDKLYMAGSKNKINGLPGFTSVAVWNDTSWSSLNFPEIFYYYVFGEMASICEYKGDIYVAGIFCITCDRSDTTNCLLRWNGINWLQVGGGIIGASDWPMCMTVYNGELYVGGYFWKQDGNVGNNIQRWDGSQWHEVGGGVNWEVFNLQVYKNKLYAMGTFDSAGGITAYGIALWNDTEWCALGDVFDSSGPVRSCIYKDSLYVGGGFLAINHNFAYTYMAEWVGGDYTSNCQNVVLGNEELEMKNEEIITVYPNPNSGVFTLQIDNGQLTINNDNIEIYNIYGQEIAPFYLPRFGGSTTFSYNINMSSEPNGIYFYRVLNSEGEPIGEGKMVIAR